MYPKPLWGMALRSKSQQSQRVLQDFAEDLQFAAAVWGVGHFRVDGRSTLQDGLHVLENSYASFAVIRTHAAFADSTKW